MQVCRELVAFHMASRKGNIEADFGCGDEFLGVWMTSQKFTFCRHPAQGCQGVPFPHTNPPPPRVTDRAAGAVVDKMTTWESTRPLSTSGQKAGFCLSAPLALQMSATGQLADFGRGSSIPHTICTSRIRSCESITYCIEVDAPALNDVEKVT